MYHTCRVDFIAPVWATLTPENVLVLTRGWWPNFPTTLPPVELVQGVTVALDTIDNFVYISRVGDIVVSEQYLDYGRDLEGNPHELLDMIAWRAGEWHAKRLVGV